MGLPAYQEFAESIRASILSAVGEIKSEAQYLLIETAVQATMMKEIQLQVLLNTPDRNDRSFVYLHNLALSWFKAERAARKDLGILTQKTNTKTVPELRDRFKKGKRQEPAIEVHPERKTVSVLKLIGNIPKVKEKEKGAELRRERLIEEMGGKCAECGATNKLEFDHPKGRTWKPEDLSPSQRIAQYEADWLAGMLRLLCRSCNASDGAKNKQGKPRWKKNVSDPPKNLGLGDTCQTLRGDSVSDLATSSIATESDR